MRKVNHLNPSCTNKANLKHASQCYKRTITFHLNKFNQSMQNKLRNLKMKTPKEFWKIINSIERNIDEQNMTLESLYTFFKDLNERNDYGNDYNEINIDVTDDDEILNSSVTEFEILKCLNSLKSNKCSANDRIINEYLKCSSEKMIPIYISLFNLVLNTGIIPDS